MTALLHSHDADGAAGDTRHRTSVHVRGGVGATRVDVEELVAIDALLDGLRAQVGHLESALSAARRDLALDATWSPALAAAAESAVEDALAGGWGARRLGEEVLELLMSLRYARLLYEEAELAAHARPPGPSWTGFLRLVLTPHHAFLAVADRLTLVGRLPGWEPTTGLGHAVDALGEIVNLVHGDDDLPPDGIALDVAVRELGEHGQNVIPWFLVPGPFPYDGRTIDPATLTGAQRLVLPVVAAFHSLTGRRPREADDLTMTVSRPVEVAPSPDLPAVVDSLHGIHQDHGAAPGTIELRRVDHADGTRSWVLLLPSTQAMVPGGRNPVDNLTNVETYGGMVSDVEIGAAEALRVSGVQPGEAVAVIGFSQGGLTAGRLAADPLVRARYSITTVVTAGSPVGHLPTPPGTQMLHLEHLEDPFVGLDGTSNPAEEARTTVSRSLATGTTGLTQLEVPPSESHSIAEYAQTARLALEAGEQSVAHVSERLGDLTGRPGDRVTATRFTLERG